MYSPTLRQESVQELRLLWLNGVKNMDSNTPAVRFPLGGSKRP
nr:MAG TPA: hypothetical protein [Caudoviricetes sp.]